MPAVYSQNPPTSGIEAFFRRHESTRFYRMMTASSGLSWGSSQAFISESIPAAIEAPAQIAWGDHAALAALFAEIADRETELAEMGMVDYQALLADED